MTKGIEIPLEATRRSWLCSFHNEQVVRVDLVAIVIVAVCHDNDACDHGNRTDERDN